MYLGDIFVIFHPKPGFNFLTLFLSFVKCMSDVVKGMWSEFRERSNFIICVTTCQVGSRVLIETGSVLGVGGGGGGQGCPDKIHMCDIRYIVSEDTLTRTSLKPLLDLVSSSIRRLLLHRSHLMQLISILKTSYK